MKAPFREDQAAMTEYKRDASLGKSISILKIH